MSSMTLEQAMHCARDLAIGPDSLLSQCLDVIDAHLAGMGEAVAEVKPILCGIGIEWANGKNVVDFLGAKLYTHPTAPAGVPDVVSEVMAELEKAIRKFPTWPTDPLHAVGVFNEEAGELSKAVLQQVYEPHKNRPDDVRKEARQAAAMAIRFIVSLDAYDWTPGAQHEQPALAAAPSASQGVE